MYMSVRDRPVCLCWIVKSKQEIACFVVCKSLPMWDFSMLWSRRELTATVRNDAENPRFFCENLSFPWLVNSGWDMHWFWKYCVLFFTKIISSQFCCFFVAFLNKICDPINTRTRNSSNKQIFCLAPKLKIFQKHNQYQVLKNKNV